MAADGSARAVVTALGANLVVAVAKFIAAAITGVDAGRRRALGGRLGQPGAAADRWPAGSTGTVGTAPVRLRPRALHLRVPGVDRAVHPRRAVRPVRGLSQGDGSAPADLASGRGGDPA